MKIIRTLALGLLALAALSACGAKDAPIEDDSEKIRVVSTVFPPYDFARQIAKDRADISMLLPPGLESHSFEPAPQDILKVEGCDVFIYVGGESDKWVNTILDSMDTGNIKVIALMDCVETVFEETVEGMEEAGHEHDEAGHEHEEAGHAETRRQLDEHVWTSPKNAMAITERISETLCLIDEENAGFYEENTKKYLEELSELDRELQAITRSAGRRTIVFGDRFPFRYLADAYGLDYYAAFPGCAEQSEASAATVAFLIDKVKSEEIPIVFFTEFSNEKMADIICEETGARKLLLHACHNVSKKDLEGGEGYLSLMWKNAANLREALI